MKKGFYIALVAGAGALAYYLIKKSGDSDSTNKTVIDLNEEIEKDEANEKVEIKIEEIVDDSEEELTPLIPVEMEEEDLTEELAAIQERLNAEKENLLRVQEAPEAQAALEQQPTFTEEDELAKLKEAVSEYNRVDEDETAEAESNPDEILPEDDLTMDDAIRAIEELQRQVKQEQEQAEAIQLETLPDSNADEVASKFDESKNEVEEINLEALPQEDLLGVEHLDETPIDTTPNLDHVLEDLPLDNGDEFETLADLASPMFEAPSYQDLFDELSRDSEPVEIETFDGPLMDDFAAANQPHEFAPHFDSLETLDQGSDKVTTLEDLVSEHFDELLPVEEEPVFVEQPEKEVAVETDEVEPSVQLEEMIEPATTYEEPVQETPLQDKVEETIEEFTIPTVDEIEQEPVFEENEEEIPTFTQPKASVEEEPVYSPAVREIHEWFPHLTQKFIHEVFIRGDYFAREFAEGTFVEISYKVSFEDMDNQRAFERIVREHSYDTIASAVDNTITVTKQFLVEQGTILGEILNIANQVNYLKGTCIEYNVKHV